MGTASLTAPAEMLGWVTAHWNVIWAYHNVEFRFRANNQGRSQKFVLGRYKRFWEGIKL